MGTALEGIKAVFLDLDGTIYLGGGLIDGALDFLQRCDDQGVMRFFLSNNSSRSVDQYVRNVEKMGIPATSDDVLLSTHDCIAWLKRNNITETYCVGTQGMCEMLEGEGFNGLTDPQYVVLDTILRQRMNASRKQASTFMQGPLMASHPDMVCPSPDGGLPDVGAFLALFKATTGVEPTHISGKPNPGMILHKIEALGLKPEECAMVVIDSTRILPWRIVPIVWVSWSFQERLRKRMLLPCPKVLNNNPRSLFHPLMRYLGDELGLKQRWQLWRKRRVVFPQMKFIRRRKCRIEIGETL